MLIKRTTSVLILDFAVIGCFFMRLTQYYVAAGLWIRIGIGSRFNGFVDLDPTSESGSRGIEIKRKNLLFSTCVFFNFITEWSVVDPDPHWIRIQSILSIRIRIGPKQ
jgi:hypothetical protein